jgi:hypothetical protein
VFAAGVGVADPLDGADWGPFGAVGVRGTTAGLDAAAFAGTPAIAADSAPVGGGLGTPAG